MNKKTVLAIETSCDDTCIALVQSQNGQFTAIKELRSSQIASHNQYGGVVPELAARLHSQKIGELLQTIFQGTSLNISQIDAIAVTTGPGLQTSLLTGTTLANFTSLLAKKPLIPVNHIWGHVVSPLLERNKADFTFPALVLTVSGGHTQMVLLQNWHKGEIIAKTRDDAAGEAFDKLSRALNLGYPGGPIVSKYAQKGNKNAFTLPKPLCTKIDGLDFSFSGLKAAAIRYITQNPSYFEEKQAKADLCASFEDTVCNIFLKKVTMALQKHANITSLWLVGGVSANVPLQQTLKTWAKTQNISFFTPKKMQYCTDNASMIATKALLMQEIQDYHINYTEPNPRLAF